MSSLAIPVLRTWSDRTAREYVLPPSLSLDRKRAASANLRHVKIFKKPRVSQQFGQAIKSVIRRKVMMASLTESKSKGGGGGGTGSSDATEGGDSGSLISGVFLGGLEQTGEKTKEQEEKKEKKKKVTQEDLKKLNEEIEKVKNSITELKAKKKEQFSQLKIMLRAEKQKQKQAAREAAERQRRLSEAAASAADSVKVEYVQDRPTMLSVNKSTSSRK